MSASIINTYPTTLQNGQLEDATVVMTLFSWIQSQVNGNACGATTGSSMLKGDGAGNTTPAVSGTDYLGVTSGLIFDYAGSTAPSGYLLCDGTAYNRVTYASLFNAIGTTWGAGDGSTTFNVPDLRRKTTIGAGGTAVGSIGTTVASTGGTETHVITSAELPTHNHAITDPTHTHTVNDPTHVHTAAALVGAGLNASSSTVPGYGYPGSWQTNAASTGISLNAASTGISVQNAGSSTAMSLMQPTAVVTKIIKV